MRRHWIWLLAGLAWILPIAPARGANEAEGAPPNVVILFADDLGYGDLGCYGHPTIRTPALDRMAAEGMRFTQFYVAECVCTPSRAALLTGRLPVRTGMCSDTRRVLFTDSAGGLPDDEITIAKALKTKGYATACVGKWHLGHLPKYLPMRRGFDEYFGIPYSNDMRTPGSEVLDPPLLRGEETIEQPAVQGTLTRRYTEEAVGFIERNKDRPFFLYLPYTFPHVPLFTNPEWKGRSARGLYGDVVEEIDWSAGRILDTIRRLGLAERTLVFFSSDNGPWLIMKQNGGSAGLLRGGKGSTWEGGMRVPGIAWWPGRIRAGIISQAAASTLDLLPTILRIAGAPVPSDRVLDGRDLSGVLFGDGRGEDRVIHFYRGTRLMAIRKGPWKAHFITQAGYGGKGPETHDPPLLYHLEHDPSEQYDVAKSNPQVVADLVAEAARHRASFTPAPSQLEARIGKKSD
ncbi:MAG: sulfatase [Planctomycetes bacterium]|nr:sulfatase [Planctomycetota bacterium]